MLKNKYIKPELEVINFSAVDIILTSVEPEQLTVEINYKIAEGYGSSEASIFEL